MTGKDNPDVRRLHRAWHAALGHMHKAGIMPRKLTDIERRGAQLAIFRCVSVWHVDPKRAHSIAERLTDLRQRDDYTDLAFAVVRHGVVAPGDPDEDPNPDRLHRLDERLAIMLDGGLTEAEAKLQIVVEALTNR